MLNSRQSCPDLVAGTAASERAGRTFVVEAFTRRLRLADAERTARLSLSVSPACVHMLAQTSKGKRAMLACDLRKIYTPVKRAAPSPTPKGMYAPEQLGVPFGCVPHCLLRTQLMTVFSTVT